MFYRGNCLGSPHTGYGPARTYCTTNIPTHTYHQHTNPYIHIHTTNTPTHISTYIPPTHQPLLIPLLTEICIMVNIHIHTTNGEQSCLTQPNITKPSCSYSLSNLYPIIDSSPVESRDILLVNLFHINTFLLQQLHTSF